jgi:hypothetical protein
MGMKDVCCACWYATNDIRRPVLFTRSQLDYRLVFLEHTEYKVLLK